MVVQHRDCRAFRRNVCAWQVSDAHKQSREAGIARGRQQQRVELYLVIGHPGAHGWLKAIELQQHTHIGAVRNALLPLIVTDHNNAELRHD